MLLKLEELKVNAGTLLESTPLQALATILSLVAPKILTPAQTQDGEVISGRRSTAGRGGRTAVARVTQKTRARRKVMAKARPTRRIVQVEKKPCVIQRNAERKKPSIEDEKEDGDNATEIVVLPQALTQETGTTEHLNLIRTRRSLPKTTTQFSVLPETQHQMSE